jgi:threonine synthase
MDILKSSNIERVMFDLYGAERTKELMEALASEGKFVLTPEEHALLKEHFSASFSDDALCESEIAAYAKKGYIMDPHTATCIKAYNTLRERSLKTVIYSTAEWTKFSRTVAKALGADFTKDLDALTWVEKEANVSVPPMIRELFEKPIVHTTVVEKDAIREEILEFL